MYAVVVVQVKVGRVDTNAPFDAGNAADTEEDIDWATLLSEYKMQMQMMIKTTSDWMQEDSRPPRQERDPRLVLSFPQGYTPSDLG